MQDVKKKYIKAVKLFQQNNLTEAEKLFREILTENQHHADSMHMMAAIGYERQRYDMAEELMGIAISEKSDDPDFYFTLANIQAKRGNKEGALQTYSKTLQFNPKHYGALKNIAKICLDQGAHFRNNNMYEAAIHHLKRALEIKPVEEDFSFLGYIYYQMGRYEDAIENGKNHIKRFPRSAKAYDNVGVCYDFMGEFEEAYTYYKKAISLDLKDPIIHANMASVLKNMGRLDEAIDIIRKSMELAPERAYIYSNLIMTMLYASSVSPEQLAEESRGFGKKHTATFRRKRAFSNDRNPNRKLRVGYVSPDFRKHAVNYFLSPIYKHNKDNVELFAYSKVEIEDGTTDNLKQYFDHWRDVKRLTDDAAADLIEKDQIDILVDLAGHTGNNGLMIFARKPAPIQVTWLGYTATTGMEEMDYRITDAYAEPEGMTEHLNTETLWRMPDIFAAYIPHENSPPVIDHPPFEDNGYVTFGCFNNFTKVTAPVLDTWAKILSGVPDSRLFLEITGIQNDKTRKEVEIKLAKHGIPLERTILEIRKPSNQYVLYNKIDIALDPFPAVGGTTSMDTVWMGVPFVTLAGKHFGSRMGVSILKNVGLEELIAQDMEEYVSIAVDLAKDRTRLKSLRHNLRERAVASPLMDQDKFARNWETALRQMWQKWVQENPA
jgi:protein O-GlcNAc transferase